ncbi:uncharacterized RNA-binding protein C1827.05c-like isoform X4 [Magnolia sinica]|uniref:uncharacterized RNA-binding protein C1827.05c-like isoform X4 n=1 Tax=Magnolia sinica TaxID=86752 RepID=UPI002659011C|nr:uncharacterized RNA-binding protein C1827.05c-like isoform X4 [Magnolia sinica]
MGVKAKKALMKKIKKSSSDSVVSGRDEVSDFLPLEGGPGRKLPKSREEPLKDIATVLYIGHIPHGFYEDQMEVVLHLQMVKSKETSLQKLSHTGKSKHYGFIEFESPEVAKIVADCMHNYLMFEHMLQVHLVPPERVHLKLWYGINHRHQPLDWLKIERKRHDKVGSFQPVPKKIRFEEEEED